MKYTEIKSNDDINNFMNMYNCFHDSCIKEIHYISGAYVSDDGWMHPINNVRSVKIIIERQAAKNANIELFFENVNELHLIPSNPKCDAIIFHAFFEIEDNKFYWADWKEFKIGEQNLNMTWIISNKCSYRILKR